MTGEPQRVSGAQEAAPGAEGNAPERGGQGSVEDFVQEPAKVVRIGRMAHEVLEELRRNSLDDAGMVSLSRAQRDAVHELRDGLAPRLREELDRLWEPFTGESASSEPELRIAQAELVGWLEGVFQGIQTAVMSQQAAQGRPPQQLTPDQSGAGERHTGHYL